MERIYSGGNVCMRDILYLLSSSALEREFFIEPGSFNREIHGSGFHFHAAFRSAGLSTASSFSC